MKTFIATTPKGMEELLKAELVSLGAEKVEVKKGAVSFTGPTSDKDDLKIAYRACLWSRTANRVLYPLKSFPCPNPEKLYGNIKSINWSEHLSPDQTLAVEFTSSMSQITHTQFGAQKVKDAVVDQFMSVVGTRPSVDLHEPDIRINVHLNSDVATVYIDLSGQSLHKRGYREQGAMAPLKENLAAAIVLSTGWNVDAGDFIDGMCGSGTMPIEAAMIAAKIAPNLKRTYFGFNGWKQHNEKIWLDLVREAEEIQIRDFKKLPKICGYDQDAFAVRTAIDNVERAGLRKLIHIEKKEFTTLGAPSERGTLVLNPPYGERLGEEEDLIPLYKSIGDGFKKQFKGWTGWVFTGSPVLAKKIGLKATRRLVFFNGAIECRLLKFELY